MQWHCCACELSQSCPIARGYFNTFYSLHVVLMATLFVLILIFCTWPCFTQWKHVNMSYLVSDQADLSINILWVLTWCSSSAQSITLEEVRDGDRHTLLISECPLWPWTMYSFDPILQVMPIYCIMKVLSPCNNHWDTPAAFGLNRRLAPERGFSYPGRFLLRSTMRYFTCSDSTCNILKWEFGNSLFFVIFFIDSLFWDGFLHVMHLVPHLVKSWRFPVSNLQNFQSFLRGFCLICCVSWVRDNSVPRQ